MLHIIGWFKHTVSSQICIASNDQKQNNNTGLLSRYVNTTIFIRPGSHWRDKDRTETKEEQNRNNTETEHKQKWNYYPHTFNKTKYFLGVLVVFFLLHIYWTASVKWIHHMALQGRWGHMHGCVWLRIPRNTSTKLKNKRFCGWVQDWINEKCMNVMNYWWICEMMILDLVENSYRLSRFFLVCPANISSIWCLIGPAVNKKNTDFRDAVSVTELLAKTLSFCATVVLYHSVRYACLKFQRSQYR